MASSARTPRCPCRPCAGSRRPAFSKRRYGPPQGLAALEAVARAVDRPVLAVGGLTPERVSEVLAAGAAGVAVIGAIYAAARPADATKAFLDALGRA
jgi:thiamine-phosphate pyrophosphorylase